MSRGPHTQEPLRNALLLAAAVAAGVTALVLAACGGDSSPKTVSAPGPWDLVALGGSMATGYGVDPKEAYTRVTPRCSLRSRA